MRVVSLAELKAMPAGTVYCEVIDGYAAMLERKDETTDDGGFWRRELLPQRTAVCHDKSVPCWQPVTWCPPDGYEEETKFYVLDQDDVVALIGMLQSKDETTDCRSDTCYDIMTNDPNPSDA